MSNQNPLIKENAKGTINASIESLQLLTRLLDNTYKLALMTEEDSQHEGEKHLSTAEVGGLSLLTSCIQSALEHGFSQCASDSNS
jgi:hypothetical protein